MNTRCFSYYCYYKYKINQRDRFKTVNHVCFSEIYKELQNANKNGVIYVFVNQDEKLNEQSIDNYCILSNKEINEYIKWLKEMTGIDVKKVKAIAGHKGEKGFSVRITMNNNYAFEIRLLLALIRNMSEYALNVSLKTAFLMKNLSEFKHLDLSERICITNNSIYNANNNHSVHRCHTCMMINNESFKNQYNNKKLNKFNVHDFYDYYPAKRFKITDYMQMDQISNDIESEIISDNLKTILINNYELMKNE